MSAQDKFYWLMGGIGAVLLLSSLIGWVLSRRVSG